MSIWEFFKEFYWVFFFLIPLAYALYRLKSGKSFSFASLRELAVFVEAGFFLLVIFLVQKYVFDEHWFFTISIPIFVIVWALAIHLLLMGDNIYVLESRILGEQYYDLENVEKIIVQTTTQRLLFMDKDIYEKKRHVGEAQYPFWNGSPRIKFTDFYDEKTGTFYHPENPQMHNISFYILKSFWLKMKKDLPEVMRENVLFTWARNYWLGYKQRVLAEKFPLFLQALEVQHDGQPFEFPDSLEKLYEQLKNEKLKAITDKPEAEPTPKDESEPVKADNKAGKPSGEASSKGAGS